MNFKKGTNNSDSVNLEQLNEATSVLATNVSKAYLQKDGTTLLTGNHKITNLEKGTNQNDAVKFELKLKESHISSHENIKNVFEYIMKTQTELTADFGISNARLSIYNKTPYLINKTA